jgi:hypothetical protein
MATIFRYRWKLPPLDVVLFTGDPTQRGVPEEFDAVNRRLDRLWEVFRFRAGSTAVGRSGNHDLQRPPPMNQRPLRWRMVVGPYGTAAPIWFWRRKVQFCLYLERVFAAYANWWEQCKLGEGTLIKDLAPSVESSPAYC